MLTEEQPYQLLLRLPPDGEAEAGVFAWLKPTPPSLSAGNGRPFLLSSEGERL